MFTLIYLERSNNELEREERICIYISLEYKNWRVKNWPTIIQESIFWLRFGTLVKNGCSEQSKQASLVITDEKTSIIETKLLSLEIVAHRSVKRRRRRRRTKFLSPFLSRWLTRTPPPWKKEEGGGEVEDRETSTRPGYWILISPQTLPSRRRNMLVSARTALYWPAWPVLLSLFSSSVRRIVIRLGGEMRKTLLPGFAHRGGAASVRVSTFATPMTRWKAFFFSIRPRVKWQ